MDTALPRETAGGGIDLTRSLLIAGTLAVYVVFVFVTALNTHNRVGPGGAPLFYDFSVFYQAGALADHGQAVAAYDDAHMQALQHGAFPGSVTRLPWSYPPTFQLLLAPLGLLPYSVAWLAWSGCTFGAYLLLARKLAPRGSLWLIALAPGAAVNLFFGQNGLVSLAFMAGGVLALSRRPILGGVLLGMTAFKPQLALVAPLVLIAAQEWRAVGAAIASQAALVLLSVLTLGMGPWLAFAHKVLEPAALAASSSSDWRSIPTVKTMVLSLGLGSQVGSLAHWMVAATALATAVWIWRRSKDGVLRAGALAAATLLVTPYLRAYDLVLLVLPMAVLLADGRRPPRPVWSGLIVLASVTPAMLMFAPAPVQYGPLVSIALLAAMAWTVRRNDSKEIRPA